MRWASPADPPGEPALEEANLSALTSPLTATSRFFVRDHFAVPQLEDSAWRLRIAGQVRSPLELTYKDIQKLPSRTLVATVECAGNGVGAGGVSTASWLGVSLATLLRRARLSPSTRQIRLVGSDRGIDNPSYPRVSFARSIPIDKALNPDTLLCYRMNGVPLPAEHGYPLRAIVPGWYGMDSVKWLVRVEALDRADTSYFMTQRYIGTRLDAVGSEQHPITRMRVKSLIVAPREGAVLTPGSYTIRGTAWAGENSVARVDVSTNGGWDWAPAALNENLRPYSWVLWSYPWRIPAAGRYAITARATDERGNTQPAERDSLRLDGYEQNSCQTVRCEVRA